jgi:hypothetical protein
MEQAFLHNIPCPCLELIEPRDRRKEILLGVGLVSLDFAHDLGLHLRHLHPLCHDVDLFQPVTEILSDELKALDWPLETGTPGR